MSPKVSIVIPTYNRRPLLQESLESALSQDWPSLEIIVVDDGSTDDTEDYLKTISDDRLIVIKQENSGVANARNQGVDASTGKFLLFLDSDDLIAPETISALVKYQSPDQLYLPTTPISFLEEHGDGNKAITPWNVDLRHADTLFFKQLQIQLGACLIDRDVFDKVGQFDTNLNSVEDSDWLYRAFLLGYKLKRCSGGQLYYRQHQNNAVKDQVGMMASHLRLKEKTFCLLRATSQDEDHTVTRWWLLLAASARKYLEACRCNSSAVSSWRSIIVENLTYFPWTTVERISRSRPDLRWAIGKFLVATLWARLLFPRIYSLPNERLPRLPMVHRLLSANLPDKEGYPSLFILRLKLLILPLAVATIPMRKFHAS